MENSYIIILFSVLISLFIWGYIRPWVEFKKIGVSLTFKELMNPQIKKDLILHRKTKRLINAMSIVKSNELNLNIQDLLDIELAGGKSEFLVNAVLKISSKGLLIDKQDLNTLVLANSDFDKISIGKTTGDKIMAVEELIKQ